MPNLDSESSPWGKANPPAVRWGNGAGGLAVSMLIAGGRLVILEEG